MERRIRLKKEATSTSSNANAHDVVEDIDYSDLDIGEEEGQGMLKHGGAIKGPWTAAEDALILQCLAEGMCRWSEIGAKIPGRVGKQCRERFFNHLDREWAATWA